MKVFFFFFLGRAVATALCREYCKVGGEMEANNWLLRQ